MKRIVKLQSGVGKKDTKFRVSIPKEIIKSVGWKYADQLMISYQGKTITIRKVRGV